MVQLECPDSDCHAVLPDAYLKEILPAEFLSRYLFRYLPCSSVTSRVLVDSYYNNDDDV